MNELLENWTLYADSWLVYIGSFSVSLFLSVLFSRINKRVLQHKGFLYAIFLIANYIIIALPVAMIIGVRGESVGFDTLNYYRSYGRMNSSFWMTLSQSSNKLEIGFIFTRWLVFKITGGGIAGAVFPMTLLTIMAMIHSFVLLGKQVNVTLGLFMFYSVFGLNMCDQARQLLAVSIFAIAIHYLYQQKILKYIFLVILAALFHNTAIIGLILVLFAGLEKRTLKEKAVIISVSFIGIMCGIQLIILKKYGIYIDTMENTHVIRFGTAWILDLIPVILPLYIGKTKDTISKKLKMFSICAIAFRLAGYVSYFIMRMYYYPAVVSWIVFLKNNLKEKQCNRRNRVKIFLLIITCILYFAIDYIVLLQHRVVPYYRIF